MDKNKIFEILIESGILAFIILLAGYFFNKNLEKFKLEQAKRNLEHSQGVEFARKLQIEKHKRELDKIDEKLSKFYYPVLFGLEKDTAVWTLSSRLTDNEQIITSEGERFVENKVLVKNHNRISEILERNIHLIDMNDTMSKALSRYLRHVAIYNMIVTVEDMKDKRPEDLGEPYPEQLQEELTKRIEFLRERKSQLETKLYNLFES